MKKTILTFLILPVFLFAGCYQTRAFEDRDESVDMSVREIVQKSTVDAVEMLNEAKSAVVGISVQITGGYAVGSGVAVTDGGYILTNNHVVEDGKNITLYLADKTTASASVVWSDPAVDLAILKSSKQIPYLSTQDLNDTFVGEDVYAIGTPLTLDFRHTVTKGIVSAQDRVLETESNAGVSYLQSLVQHDASINPGNSGGPLVSAQGKVIGLNTLKATESEGIGFAIPIKLGKIVTEKLKENPNYKTPFIGVFAFDSALAKVYSYENFGEGVYVVASSGPAGEAGIKKGDVIQSINNQKVRNMLDFRSEIYQKDVNEIIEVGFERNGIFQTVSIKLGSRT